MNITLSYLQEKAYCPDCIVNLYIQDTKISVPPAVELGTAGPPALNRYIISRLLKE